MENNTTPVYSSEKRTSACVNLMHLVLQLYLAVCWMFYHIEYPGMSHSFQVLRQCHIDIDTVERITKKVQEVFVSLLLCEIPLISHPGCIASCCDAFLDWQYCSVPQVCVPTPRRIMFVYFRCLSHCTNTGNINIEILYKKHFWAQTAKGNYLPTVLFFLFMRYFLSNLVAAHTYLFVIV